MSKVDKVKSALTAFARKADGALAKGDYSKIARARDNTKSFGRDGNASLYDYVDLGCFSREIEDLYPEEAAELKDAVDDCVIHNVTNIRRASGMSVYFPYENTDMMENMIKMYDAENYNDNYSSFIHDFTGVLNGEEIIEWTVRDNKPTAKEDSKKEFSVKISKEEAENLSAAYASIWEKDETDESGETYIFWLDSENTVVDEDGNLNADIDGKRFFLTDDSGEKYPIYAIQTESTDEYAEYVTYLTKGHMTGDTSNVSIYIRVDDKHPEGVITGIYELNSAEKIGYAQKKVETIEDGEHLLLSYFSRKIKFNDDGSVEPFDTWEEAGLIGNEFDVKGQLKVVFEKPETEHDYIGLFDIRDTQGKSHYSNYININVD